MKIQLRDDVSIFDIYLEHIKDTSDFKWGKLQPGESLEKSDTRLKGPLRERLHDPTPKLVKSFFILTKTSLYKYNTERDIDPVAVLRLWNPRLEIVKETESQKYGFRLTARNQKYEFFAESKEEMLRWFAKLKKYSILLHLAHEYVVSGLIGKGNYAKVHLSKKISTSREYAIKSIEKTKMAENTRNLKSIINEIELLRLLVHPHIIKLYEVYESDKYIHLVLEYLKGGELFQRIENKGTYTEKDASHLIHSLLQTIHFCHSKGIIHRDLKPENIILAEEDRDNEFKLVDFGLATRMGEGKLEKLKCGSPGYVAPEVLYSVGYDTKADIFSIGIITYILLSGISPFSGDNFTDLLTKNKECLIMYPSTYWKNISMEAKDLVKQLVQKDPEFRITAKKALEHPWFENATEDTSLSSVVAALRQKNYEAYEAKETDSKVYLKEAPNENANISLLTMTPVLRGRKLPEKKKDEIPYSPLLVGRLKEKSNMMNNKIPSEQIKNSQVTYSPLLTANHNLTFKEQILLRKKEKGMKVLQEFMYKKEEDKREVGKKLPKFQILQVNTNQKLYEETKENYSPQMDDSCDLNSSEGVASPPYKIAECASAGIFKNDKKGIKLILASTFNPTKSKQPHSAKDSSKELQAESISLPVCRSSPFVPGKGEYRHLPLFVSDMATHSSKRKMSASPKESPNELTVKTETQRRYSEQISPRKMQNIINEELKDIPKAKKESSKKSIFFEDYGRQSIDEEGQITFRANSDGSDASENSYATPEMKPNEIFFTKESKESVKVLQEILGENNEGSIES